jgi:GNAT superfamily N-acetyltransferase
MPYRFDADYREDATLGDGTPVLLRLVRPADAALLAAGFARLSPESRYRRFFTDKATLSESELRYLTDVDGERHFAIGARRRDRGDEGVGIARFVRLEDQPGVAEPAVAVVDEAQGKGLGRLLLSRLIAAAKERGVERFRFEVLATNAAMRNLLAELAPGSHESADGSTVVVEAVLADLADGAPPQPSTNPLYRLLTLIASGLLLVRQTARDLLQR